MATGKAFADGVKSRLRMVAVYSVAVHHSIGETEKCADGNGDFQVIFAPTSCIYAGGVILDHPRGGQCQLPEELINRFHTGIDRSSIDILQQGFQAGYIDTVGDGRGPVDTMAETTIVEGRNICSHELSLAHRKRGWRRHDVAGHWAQVSIKTGPKPGDVFSDRSVIQKTEKYHWIPPVGG